MATTPNRPDPAGGERIHATAVIDPGVTLSPTVIVAPYAVIGAGVALADGVVVGSHAVLEGPLEVGPGAVIAPFACLGQPPQDRKYTAAEPRNRTGVRVGPGAVIREFTTIHRGTDGWTVIGAQAMVMAYCHVAHDCVVGERVVLANGATLAGHVEIGADAYLGGMAAVHQFCRIGRLAFLAAHGMAERDIPPFCRAIGDRARLAGLNVVGLRRAGMDTEALTALHQTYRHLFRNREGTLAQRLTTIEWANAAVVAELAAFVTTSSRGICR